MHSRRRVEIREPVRADAAAAVAAAAEPGRRQERPLFRSMGSFYLLTYIPFVLRGVRGARLWDQYKPDLALRRVQSSNRSENENDCNLRTCALHARFEFCFSSVIHAWTLTTASRSYQIPSRARERGRLDSLSLRLSYT